MIPEEGSSSSPIGAPVETVLAETGPRPGASGTTASEPTVEIERRVVERTPVSALAPAVAGEHFDALRTRLAANPKLLDDPQFMTTYGALAARERDHALTDVLAQDLQQLGPYGRIPSPEADVRTELTPEQWTRRLGAPQGDLGAAGPEGDWNAADLNQAVARFESYGLPGYSADAIAKAEVALAHQTWNEADARRALEAEHGPETARRMISDAQYMLNRMYRDPWGRARIEHWAGEDGRGLNHPQLIATLADLITHVDAGNAKWMALEQAELADARARAAEAAERVQREAQAADDALRAEAARHGVTLPPSWTAARRGR